MAARPVITDSPRDIQYRGTFDLKVAGSTSGIRSVALVRSDHNTHSLTAGDRHVKLAFRPKGDASRGELRVYGPDFSLRTAKLSGAEPAVGPRRTGTRSPRPA